MIRSILALGLVAWVAAGSPHGAVAQDDAAFADQLWQALVASRLAGPNAILSVPYARQGEAHADTLITLEAQITVGAVTGTAIVKKSFGEPGATREAIMSDPARYLSDITVMFQREAGFDASNQNWFWAMYAPSGMVGEMDGMNMAGRVGMCIECHRAAPGNDYLFLHD